MPKDHMTIPEYVHRPVAHLNKDVTSMIMRTSYFKETVRLAGQIYAAKGKAGRVEFDLASYTVKPRLISASISVPLLGLLFFVLFCT